jgi:hypothetical protein
VKASFGYQFKILDYSSSLSRSEVVLLNMSSGDILTQGWQSAQNERGTIDILWSCASTLFICVWVMMHLNIPSRRDRKWTIYLRKAKWLVLGVLAPELVMLFASGQWASAKRSVRDMRHLEAKRNICEEKQEECEDRWTMTHAFYADSGGFMLAVPDCGGMQFPITAKQILWLVEHEFLDIPCIAREEIWDKSKADFFAKAIAAMQVGWFVIQFVARGAQKLPITLLEVATLALISCSAASFFFWFCKPLDVGLPTTLELKNARTGQPQTIANVLLSAGEDAKQQWRDTPMDFCDPLKYSSEELPFNKLWGENQRPLPRIPNDRDSQLHDFRTVIIVAIPTAAFGALHCIAWNFIFPTKLEQQIWRWTSVGGGLVLAGGCTAEAASIIWHGYTTTGLNNLGGYKLKWPNNLMFFIPGALYVVGRLVIIVEVCISLRALPAGCLETPQWPSIFPHV